MILEGFKEKEEHRFDPLSYKVILTLAIATSIDAMAIGVSMAFMQINTWSAVWPAGRHHRPALFLATVAGWPEEYSSDARYPSVPNLRAALY